MLLIWETILQLLLIKLKGEASAGGKRLWWHQSILTSLIRKSNLILSNMTVFSLFFLSQRVWFMMLDSPLKNIYGISLFFSFTFTPKYTKHGTLSVHLAYYAHVTPWSCHGLKSCAPLQNGVSESLVSVPRDASSSSGSTLKFLTATPGLSCSRFQSESLSIRPECIRFYWECAAKNTGLPGWKCILMGAWTQRHVMICLAHRVT